MKKFIPLLIPIIFAYFLQLKQESQNVLSFSTINNHQNEEFPDKNEYWFLLNRQSNIEVLYHGIPGDTENSKLVKTFIVKTGVPGEKPTPLPQLAGKDYWLITDKFKAQENSDIGPYFLKLDIPYSEEPPYGPKPYQECDGQCDWELPGSFGLHGVAGDETKLDSDNEGSSGCIRHSDKDITILYHLLDPKTKPVRYYID